jgi:hypothetical protein
MIVASALRRTSFAMLAAAALLSPVLARADVPPPVVDPPANGGGGGVQPPPAPTPDPGSTNPPQDPSGGNSLPPIPPPSGLGSNPEHPDPSVGNTPPAPWYNDMYEQIYYSSYYFSQIEEWAWGEYQRYGYDEIWNVYIYAAYLRVYMTEYYWNAYDQYEQPRTYSFGHATRGDFNYGYEYWVRPVYFKLVEATGDYYGHYSGSPGFDDGQYQGYVKPAFVQYHRFTKCNFGKNGKDPLAKDDDKAFAFERSAGITVSAKDIIP